MSELAKKHRDQLERVKSNIENAYLHFDENYKRYNDYRNFVFVSTLNNSEISLLNTLKKPVVEFNVLEAYISRLRGEFSKNEPSVEVSAKDGKEVDPEIIKTVEGHLRYILKESNKDGLEYNCYTDTLSGGFSAMKVYTDYTGEMSFHQDIHLKRVFDPTMTGFDPLAERQDKTDGEFCFEVFPRRRTDFEKEYPELNLKGVSFKRNMSSIGSDNVGPFSWSYKTNKDDILLVCDYYEKKKVKKNIVMLADGQVMTKEEYNKFIKNWEAQGIIAQPPAIIGKPRKTEITKIVRYKVIENQIFDYQETDYKSLPIIFIDGNSILTKEDGNGSVRQMTRPYIYQAKGAQKLKNFCGQTLANEIENMGPSKMIAALPAIPPQYLDAYNNPQEAHIYIYNPFLDGDPNVPLRAPEILPRPPIPAEISNAFMGADAIVQNVLGSFDATMSKITDQQVSGKAIEESTTLSNSAAMPYVVSFLKGLQSAAQMIVDMIPYYYRTPRTIPVMDPTGRKSYVKINQDGGISMDYDHDAIQVSVDAGVNFSVQQSKALNQIISLMNASPLFAQFVNDEGLDIVLDNVEIRNVEELRKRSQEWMQRRQVMMQQQAGAQSTEQQALQLAAQQVEKENQLGQAKIQVQAASEQAKAEVKSAEIELQREKNQMELLRLLAEIRNKRGKLNLEQQKADDRRMESLIEAELKASTIEAERSSRELDEAIRILSESDDIMEMEPISDNFDLVVEDIEEGDK